MWGILEPAAMDQPKGVLRGGIEFRALHSISWPPGISLTRVVWG
jgi:hypothetical protein